MAENWPDLKDLDLAELQAGKIVVRRKPSDDEIGSIALPDSAKEELPIGRVVKINPNPPVGRGFTSSEINWPACKIRVGDTIVFFSHDATSLDNEKAIKETFGKGLLILNVDAVLLHYPKEKIK